MRPRRFALATLALLACGGERAPTVSEDAGTGDAGVEPGFEECEAGPEGLVRTTYLAALGSRPRSQAEVNVLVDLMSAADARDLDGRRVMAEAIFSDPRFIDRWSAVIMDALEVPRIEDQSQRSCYGERLREDDGGELARHVLDTPPRAGGDGGGPFTMVDLLRSSIAADNLSPIYRGHLFALVSRPIPAANVPAVQAELARREDFGLIFDATYLNRDLVCLECHNSGGSVTEHIDPEENRHWPLPGRFEQALYGSDFGIAPDVAHSVFRYADFVSDDGQEPWEWSPSCGSFNPGGLPADPAEVDGLFAGLSGDTLTVYDLERVLRKGFEELAKNGLDIGADGELARQSEAFAYLVAAAISESVWREIVGTPLTIANHFPRNEASRDILHDLTETFVSSGFSLRELVLAVVTSPYVNRASPTKGCGASAYNMPPVFDPWTTGAADPEQRGNGPGDAVVALSGRTLLRSAYEALDWTAPYFQDFPERPFSINTCMNFYECDEMADVCSEEGTCCQAHDYWCVYEPTEDEPSTPDLRRFLSGVGVFLKHGTRGFRGLDFQARLLFEDRFGACRSVREEPDFIDRLLDRAAKREDSTLGDVVLATKDRLIGEPFVSEVEGASGVSEREAIEVIFSASLDGPVSELDPVELESNTRELCGVLLSTPQFLLTGLAPSREGAPVPALTAPSDGYRRSCEAIAERGLSAPVALRCSGSKLALD